MKLRLLQGTAALLLGLPLAWMAGCDHLGSSRIETVERPEKITDFKTLYNQNCAGCHGENGQNGASLAFNNPAYQAWVDDATLQRIIAMGEPPTQMPAFSQSAGGMLTDAQIDALVKGMRAEWGKDSAGLKGQMPPAQPEGHGDSDQGAKTYQTACASCHSKPNQKVTDPTYLALVNDRTLRAIIVTGRPDLGHPDYRGQSNGQTLPGYPLTGSQVEDIIAYLKTFKSTTPGQPYEPQQ